MNARPGFAALLSGAIALQAQTVTIKDAAGWLESAHVRWQASGKADGYNVYCIGEKGASRKLDDPLVRSYGGYWRADAPGLQAGIYTLKVVPVVDGKEGVAATTSPVTVMAHDRAGFAFSGGRVPGAYELDGTPMAGAAVVYVTEKTRNTVSLSVAGAGSDPCVGLQAILDGYKKGEDARPLIVRVVGQVTDPVTTYGGDIVVENGNLATGHITIEGVGDDALADGWGIRLKNASNVEIRNLGIMNVNSGEGDDIGLQQNNDHVWIHNNDFFYGDAGSDADQAKGDGALDCKKSSWVTFSYNRFWDNGKVNLLGLSEGTTSGLYATYHHNWFDHSDSRHPRVRYYSAHVYNNYYDGVAKYGAGSTLGSSVFMEANHFRNCKYPMLTSMQGSDVWSDAKQANDYANMGTFSGEDGGTIKAWSNHMEGQKRFVAYGSKDHANSLVDFDAYVAASRSEKVPATVKSAYGANTYNNFDTDASVMYAYVADDPQAARAKVTTYAGRVQGGDFKWSFDDAVDDTSYAVNAKLKAALVGYRTSLVCIQGEAGCSTASIAPRRAGESNPIRFDSRSGTLSVADGWSMRSARVFTLQGRRIPASESSAGMSLSGIGSGVFVVRVLTDRGMFESLVAIE